MCVEVHVYINIVMECKNNSFEEECHQERVNSRKKGHTSGGEELGITMMSVRL